MAREWMCGWLFVSLKCTRYRYGLKESVTIVWRIGLAPLPSCMGFLHEMRIDKDIRYHYKGGNLNLCAIVLHRSSCEVDATFDSAVHPARRED